MKTTKPAATSPKLSADSVRVTIGRTMKPAESCAASASV